MTEYIEILKDTVNNDILKCIFVFIYENIGEFSTDKNSLRIYTKNFPLYSDKNRTDIKSNLLYHPDYSERINTSFMNSSRICGESFQIVANQKIKIFQSSYQKYTFPEGEKCFC